MKAALATKYGSPSVISLATVEDPVVGSNEVLIEVRATTVTAGDARLRALRVPPGFGLVSRLAFGIFSLRNPILGAEVSGVVTAVGERVTKWSVGDAVFAECGMRLGGHAERCVLSEDAAIARKPASLSFEEAAALSFGGITALDFLRRAKLQRGERVLINGASGAVGTAAVQLTRHFGAHVTAVCSARNAELVRSLGAHEVIDYEREDFASLDATYEVVMDVVGTAPYKRSKRVLRPGGRLLLVAAGLPEILQSLWINATTDKRLIAGPASEKSEDLRTLAALVEQGEYRAVIEKTYPFERIAEAHAHVDTGRKKGSVVVSMR